MRETIEHEQHRKNRAFERAVRNAINELPVNGTLTVRIVESEDQELIETYRVRHQPMCCLENSEAEPEKTTASDNEILFAVIGGVVAGVVLMVAFGLILFAVLSHARG